MSTRPRDGARAQLAPRSENISLPRTSQQPPDDLDHLFDGLDRTAADLSWDAPRPGDINPKTGERWLYPKKGAGSNLEDFKEEIEERTRNGQGCKAIAEALIEKGVDTSSMAVSAKRLKWGFRQKKPRKMTEQGIANIRRAHDEQKARAANTARVPSVPKLPQRERVRKMRKAEILRMTKEGMSSEEIAENLQARGVTFNRGALQRLRTEMGLPPDARGDVNYLRKHCNREALKKQKDQFESIAFELGIKDVQAWVKSKMDDEYFIISRREYAHKLMGDFRTTHPYPPENKNRSLGSGAGQNHVAPPADQPATSSQPDTPLGQGAAHDPIELSEDDTDMKSEADQDCEGSDDDQALAGRTQPQPPPVNGRLDPSQPSPSHPNSSNALSYHSIQAPATEIDKASHSPPTNQAALAYPPGSNATTASNLQNGASHPQYGAGANMQQRQPGPNGISQHQHAQHAPVQEQQPLMQHYNPAPAVPAPFYPPSQGRVDPPPPGASTAGERRVAPQPVYSASVFRPPVPYPPAVNAPPTEAEIMARYGLYPSATSREITQTYETPFGLIQTQGYEYVPREQVRGSTHESLAAGRTSTQQQQQQQQQEQQQPQYRGPTMLPQNNTVAHGPPNTRQRPPEPEVTVVRPSAPPMSNNIPAPLRTVPPEDTSTHRASYDAMPAPAPPYRSRIPAPPLVIHSEEAERHKASYEVILKHQKVGFECMDYLVARTDARPVMDSLTGLPPSLKDVEDAKARLKESAEAILASL